VILIGQYDSPFVRRVGLTLVHYGLSFEHRPWSTFGDAEKLAAFNPLLRVPTLVLDTHESLIETSSIIDYLDGLVPAAQRLTPQKEPERRHILKTVGLAAGISDKAVSLFYELRLHDQPSQRYVDRLRQQIKGGLDALEASALPAGADNWHGSRLTQADLAIVCMWRHFTDCHAELARQLSVPRITAHAAQFEELSMFKTVSQPFIAPA
jgi:glutathione S-transferase